jgi:hypothetical protein
MLFTKGSKARPGGCQYILVVLPSRHQGREFVANGALENGAFCTVFSENFYKF